MTRLLWTQRQDIGAPARYNSAAAYDAARSRVVLFGGSASTSSTLFNDTWEWDGEYWTQVEDIGPSPRSGHAVAYDGNRNRIVLFGGLGSASLGDTWEWDGQEWTQIQDTGPSPRFGHALAYDGKRGRTILFGGYDGQNSCGDTWAWDGTDWTKVEDTGPPARDGHGMAYDSARDRIVVFGGATRTLVTVTQTVSNGGWLGGSHTETVTQQQLQLLGDTWEYSGTLWTRVADTGPAARTECGLVFTGTECLLFGGDNTQARFNDSWIWDGKFWTERQDIGPSPRTSMAMTYDGNRNRTVLFGGSAPPAVLGDTWEQSTT